MTLALLLSLDHVGSVFSLVICTCVKPEVSSTKIGFAD